MAKTKSKPKSWRNRIVNTGERPAKDFNFNPSNWKDHPQTQRDALTELLDSIGWITGVIVSASTGLLIDGHARVDEALKENPEQLVPFIEVDLSPEEEKIMLALFDPVGAMAITDNAKIVELVEGLHLESSALLEIVATMSRSNLTEVVELPRQDNSVGETLQYLKFGGESIPITDEELAELRIRFEAYVKETGIIYGFAGHLLGL